MFIGIDVGTTAVKATLFEATGDVVAQYHKPYPIHRSEGNRVEQNPDNWMENIYAALAQFVPLAGKNKVQAIGLTSHY